MNTRANTKAGLDPQNPTARLIANSSTAGRANAIEVRAAPILVVGATDGWRAVQTPCQRPSFRGGQAQEAALDRAAA